MGVTFGVLRIVVLRTCYGSERMDRSMADPPEFLIEMLELPREWVARIWLTFGAAGHSRRRKP